MHAASRQISACLLGLALTALTSTTLVAKAPELANHSISSAFPTYNKAPVDSHTIHGNVKNRSTVVEVPQEKGNKSLSPVGTKWAPVYAPTPGSLNPNTYVGGFTINESGMWVPVNRKASGWRPVTPAEQEARTQQQKKNAVKFAIPKTSEARAHTWQKEAEDLNNFYEAAGQHATKPSPFESLARAKNWLSEPEITKINQEIQGALTREYASLTGLNEAQRLDYVTKRTNQLFAHRLSLMNDPRLIAMYRDRYNIDVDTSRVLRPKSDKNSTRMQDFTRNLQSTGSRQWLPVVANTYMKR